MEKRAKRASADALAFVRVAVRPWKESEFFALEIADNRPQTAGKPDSLRSSGHQRHF